MCGAPARKFFGLAASLARGKEGNWRGGRGQFIGASKEIINCRNRQESRQGAIGAWLGLRRKFRMEEEDGDVALAGGARTSARGREKRVPFRDSFRWDVGQNSGWSRWLPRARYYFFSFSFLLFLFSFYFFITFANLVQIDSNQIVIFSKLQLINLTQ
jgi:hypothetical protein